MEQDQAHQDQLPDPNQASLDQEDDAQPDPALLAAMGFSSFGAAPKPNKRQKLDSTTFTSSNAQSEPGIPVRPAAPIANTVTTAGPASRSSQANDLDTLAKGVRDENGDVAFFKPSFIEDPWRDLVKGKP
ncbi:hypothetical protein K431DRAFT_344066 [Polychaeton citri CBS 116435]|uniref:Uncharacterized protein n=1 Tax=Polychaeton citri CBS 116435 TaxID=1314669 RepID=A0A9P4QGI6_9PEZI|nr:hypothetical protein K431DRAFT_344066 [Polychaeton citri CBS 116435]